MSGYQYYDFHTLDKPLTRQQMSELRGYSTRAEITPTRFANSYNWGSFKGNSEQWMGRYFDAHLYSMATVTAWSGKRSRCLIAKGSKPLAASSMADIRLHKGRGTPNRERFLHRAGLALRLLPCGKCDTSRHEQ
jgi:hypothetical protein